MADRSNRTCCSKRCRSQRAVSLQTNGGRKPIHGGCVGGVLSPIYRRWSLIKARCHSPSNNKFGVYGARGIHMCQEWRDSFSAFKRWAEIAGFSPELQIDRIDNDLGYSPDNCRWVTLVENQANRRKSIIFPTGETTAQVAARLGMRAHSIRERLKSGMTMELAGSMPFIPNGNQRKTFIVP